MAASQGDVAERVLGELAIRAGLEHETAAHPQVRASTARRGIANFNARGVLHRRQPSAAPEGSGASGGGSGVMDAVSAALRSFID